MAVRGSVAPLIARAGGRGCARVVVVDRTADVIEAVVAEIVAAGGEATGVVADVTDPEACTAMVGRAWTAPAGSTSR